MSQYEVTNAQYAAFLNAIGVGSNGTYSKGGEYENAEYIDLTRGLHVEYKNGRFVPKSGYENHPAVMVSWYGARNYSKWVGGRLPTEEEWEYAARGGNKSKGYKYAGSNEINDLAWYYYNSGEDTHAVGGKEPNELGLYDMSGNVWEWCKNRWSDYNSNDWNHDRVRRGGGWLSGSGDLFKRAPNNATLAEGFIGFRPVVPL